MGGVGGGSFPSVATVRGHCHREKIVARQIGGRVVPNLALWGRTLRALKVWGALRPNRLSTIRRGPRSSQGRRWRFATHPGSLRSLPLPLRSEDSAPQEGSAPTPSADERLLVLEGVDQPLDAFVVSLVLRLTPHRDADGAPTPSADERLLVFRAS